MTAVLLARVHAFGGERAVAELLQTAGSRRSVAYLRDTANWISYDEAIALLRAGASVTHHPQFAYAVGTDAVRRLKGSPVAALLRSLGSPEAVYRQISAVAFKFSVAIDVQATDVGPGYAELVATALDGFPPSAERCAWTRGLLSQPTILFGRQPATVEHEECAALGAPSCRYRITWGVEQTAPEGVFSAQLAASRDLLDAMKKRLHSMFATASDLIGADEIDEVLARITDRAAVEVRAARHLLAVRTSDHGELHCHHKGFDEHETGEVVQRLLSDDPASLPESWLVVPVRSGRRDYGRLVAMYDPGTRFLPQERELFEVYARLAATALDNATALGEARQRYVETSALLDLARALADAGTSGEIAHRLGEAVPLVVDCDRVGVYLWDPGRVELVRRSVWRRDGIAPPSSGEWAAAPVPGGWLERFLGHPDTGPTFVDHESGEAALRELFSGIGAVASIVVPLATPDAFLGALTVSVMDRAERMRPHPDLLDRLSGVAAQASTALQDGRLVDEITYQAQHDGLTGLANRLRFTDALRTAIARAREGSGRVTLYYIDLDAFKPVNDELGHLVGDQLLVAVGKRLTSSTRPGDLVSRLGGDEFAVLIDGDGPENTRAVPKRLERAFGTPFGINGYKIAIGASIGKAVFPDDADSAESLLRVADAAMFDAKRTRDERGQGPGVSSRSHGPHPGAARNAAWRRRP
jgi:diguanylate cyclase (GGDEF)-like protein